VKVAVVACEVLCTARFLFTDRGLITQRCITHVAFEKLITDKKNLSQQAYYQQMVFGVAAISHTELVC